MKLEKARALPIVKAALKEDIGKADITTDALVGKLESADAAIVARQECVVCGLALAEWAVAEIDYSVRFKPNACDGDLVGVGKEVAFLEGHTASILRAERTMLNFLTFLSGIATATKRFVDKAAPYGVRVLDTRKTLPLLRYLEKYAIAAGGGANHRMGLYDQVLIKDNHIKAAGLRSRVKGESVSLKKLIDASRARSPKGTLVEIEVTSIEEFTEALAGKPDIIMLDNMTPDMAKACVGIRRSSKHRPLLEVSGGITLDTIEAYARTGVDTISVGSLTASVDAIDMSLDIV